MTAKQSVAWTQHTIDLDSIVGRPNIGDMILIVPECHMVTITPGVWTLNGSTWTHLVVGALDSVVLSCPNDGHAHNGLQAQIMRVAYVPREEMSP